MLVSPVREGYTLPAGIRRKKMLPMKTGMLQDIRFERKTVGTLMKIVFMGI